MYEIRHILVPVDFSEASEVAVRRAASLARALDADLTILHVWEPAPAVTPAQLGWLATDTTSFCTKVEDDLRNRLKAWLQQAAPHVRGDVPMLVEAGYVANSILETLRNGPYDLVVMGTHGRRGLSHLVLGSVAERIVRSAPCPVLTTRVPSDDATVPARIEAETVTA